MYFTTMALASVFLGPFLGAQLHTTDGRTRLVASPALREGVLLLQVSKIAWCVCWAHGSFFQLIMSDDVDILHSS